jgi:hypothetical protein
MGGTINNAKVPAPSRLLFPSLGKAAVLGGQGQTYLLTAGSSDTAVKTINLLTCVAVIYYRQDKNAWIHHSGSGAVTRANFDDALANLATSAGATGAGKVWIIYAHDNATDQTYQQDLINLEQWGVPNNQITEVTNVNSFGIDKFGLLGC